ncbi:DNA topoisomerase 3 [Ferrovum myxofaciens]|uniref:DNA topoisomerase n=1 Tax=Ferrovum myxofaciens TaxID=416213 RepID=A0A149VVX1_9PROT|nr:DNA topoisomerase 3 [Ferrovum myxofaciens]KXW57326.1 DNA topoisomerase 3 [Ferrovum myxofaciens]
MTKPTIIIAEKPSMGRAIADVIPGVKFSKNGYIEIGSTIVTWCVGHLLENAQPEEYNPAWKSWAMKDLPFPITQWKVTPKPKTLTQLNIIGSLLKQAGSVVNAGDPDREGLMLVNEVLEYFHWTGPTERLILNSYDTPSVKKALANLTPNSVHDNLYEAAKCRSRADWLLGLSATRAATRAYTRFEDKTVISIGRVQTPALWLVVKRDLEIDNFNAKSFFTLAAHTNTQAGAPLILTHEPGQDNRIWDKPIADALAAKIKGTNQTLSVTQNKIKASPPKPYNLLSFSTDANEAFGWSAKECLDVLQELYSPEYALTTYPRTDCEYLKSEQMPDALTIAQACLGVLPEAQAMTSLMKPRKAFYDSAKVTEHHAIIPTMKKPWSGLSGKHLDAYRLVAKRFILGLLPDHEYHETVAAFTVDGRTFSVKGEVDLNSAQAWIALTQKKTKAPLPAIANGEKVTVNAVKVNQGKTSPPKRYTEASLCQDMASVAKFVTDPVIKARLKENDGIGTPATWQSIIETLKNRRYIEPMGKKQIVSTDFGKELVKTISPNLMAPGLTALWEIALESVAKGGMKPEEFMARATTFVTQRVNEMKNATIKISPPCQKPTSVQKSEGPHSPRKATQSKSSRSSASKSKSKLMAHNPTI